MNRRRAFTLSVGWGWVAEHLADLILELWADSFVLVDAQDPWVAEGDRTHR